MKTSHLTNEELIAQLTLRDDLTDLELDLLDRLIRTNDAVRDLERRPQTVPMAQAALA